MFAILWKESIEHKRTLFNSSREKLTSIIMIILIDILIVTLTYKIVLLSLV